MSPREMVRSALKEGHNEYAPAFEYVKQRFKHEMSAQQFSQNRRLILAEPEPTQDVAVNGVELARMLKLMVKSAGIQRVRETLDIVEELAK